MEEEKIIKRIIITVEERLVKGKIVQDANITRENISVFEALGLLRLYEQQTSLSILQNQKDKI